MIERLQYTGNKGGKPHTILSEARRRVAAGEFGLVPDATTELFEWAQRWLVQNLGAYCPDLHIWTDKSKVIY